MQTLSDAISEFAEHAKQGPAPDGRGQAGPRTRNSALLLQILEEISTKQKKLAPTHAGKQK